MERTIVWIAHVPYEHRGGEDTHIEALQKAYSNLSCEVILIPKNRKASGFQFMKAAKSILMTDGANEWDELLKYKKPNFIHMHNAFPQLGPRFFKWATKNNIPLVMTTHNHRFFCTNGLALRDGTNCKACFKDKAAWRPLLYNCNQSIAKTAYHSIAMTEMWVEKFYQKSINQFIAPSPYIQNELVRWGIEKDKVIQITNPIPFQSDDNVKNIGYDVFYAGRFSQEKGIKELLKLVALRADLKFLMAGSGPLENLVSETAAQLKNLKVLSQISTQEVQRYIQESKIGILPSVCNEILPTFVLEVLAHGKPCVVSKQESTEWLSEKPWDAILTNSQNSKTLSQDIDQALQRPYPTQDNVQEIRQLISIEKFQNELMSKVISKYL